MGSKPILTLACVISWSPTNLTKKEPSIRERLAAASDNDASGAGLAFRVRFLWLVCAGYRHQREYGCPLPDKAHASSLCLPSRVGSLFSELPRSRQLLTTVCYTRPR